MNAPRIYRVILPVRNLDEAVRFYVTLLGQNGARVSGGRHYFDCGGVILACLDPSGDGDDVASRPNQEYIYFAVDELEAYHARARELGALSPDQVHGAPAGAIIVRPWGERSFYVRDPTGNPLCFVDEQTLFTGPVGLA
jgi:catechol 2,3-dioxygenase-like lactoylglutathione lyase family enzyme